MTELKTLFHKSDPDTSRDAAEKMVKSGALSRQEQRVWYAIHCFLIDKFTFTARELCNHSGLDYYLIQRRLSGLHNKGKIERTGEKRDGCCMWRMI